MSKSWALTDGKGNREFTLANMDIVWENGKPLEILEPSEVLDQRIRKCALTRKGTNLFDGRYGLLSQTVIGGKNFGDALAKLIADDTLTMLEGLKEIQNEALLAQELDPAELIDEATNLSVINEGTRIIIRVNINTQAGIELESSVLIPVNRR